MTESSRERKSLWELAGYPGVPSSHQLQTSEDVDRVFKGRLLDMEVNGAETLDRVEAVLAWTTLREDDLRGKLQYYYDYEVLNQSTNMEAGPAELLEYHEQVDQIRREVEKDVSDHLNEGGSEKSAQWLRSYRMKRRHDAETSLHRPDLPGATESWNPKHPFLKSLGWGMAWGLLTLLLGSAAGLLHELGPIARLATTVPWVGVSALASAIGLVTYVVFDLYDFKPISQNRWLGADRRGNWPVLVWSLVVGAVAVTMPLWATAIWIPASAAGPLLIPRFRRRLLQSVGGAQGQMLEARELVGKEPFYGCNVFVPPNSSTHADGPALPASLPGRSRDGSPAYSVDATQGTLHELAEHAGVQASGLESDVHKVTASLLLDVAVGVTGADDLRLVAQYGSGPMHVVARAVTLGLGQDLMDEVLTETVPKPGRAVAPWMNGEVRAYREFVENLLVPDDAKLALLTAARILESTKDLDYPHLARYRMETLTYALAAAASSMASA